MSTIITDPTTVTQLAESLNDSVITTVAPQNTLVELPGGFRTASGEVVKTAEVRELNGSDEEAISVIENPGAKLNRVLERGLVKIGDAAPAPFDTDALLAGDRDALLLGIRRVTFGDIETMNVICSNCSTTQEIKIHLLEDIPFKTFAIEDYALTFSVDTKLGKLVVAYPNGMTQRKISEAVNKTTAELVTMLISGCVVSLDDKPVDGASVALALGMQDRNNIIDLISQGAPGPRLGEVKKTCEACGTQLLIPLGLQSLFRLW